MVIAGRLQAMRQQLRPAVTSQKSLDDFELELCFVLFHETFEVCPTSGGQLKPGAIQMQLSTVMVE